MHECAWQAPAAAMQMKPLITRRWWWYTWPAHVTTSRVTLPVLSVLACLIEMVSVKGLKLCQLGHSSWQASRDLCFEPPPHHPQDYRPEAHFCLFVFYLDSVIWIQTVRIAKARALLAESALHLRFHICSIDFFNLIIMPVTYSWPGWCSETNCLLPTGFRPPGDSALLFWTQWTKKKRVMRPEPIARTCWLLAEPM